MKDEIILSEDELSPRMRAWLAQARTDAFVVSCERLQDGRLRLRPLRDVDPLLLAHVRTTIGNYHEALMNLR